MPGRRGVCGGSRQGYLRTRHANGDDEARWMQRDECTECNPQASAIVCSALRALAARDANGDVPCMAFGPDPEHDATILVTGGAGFVGVNFVRRLLAGTACRIVSFDALTYAANPVSQESVSDTRHRLVPGDVRDAAALRQVLLDTQPDAVVHLAAESHVDRSIDAPAVFLETNVLGTFTLLQESLRHWKSLPPERAKRFRMLHVSTDEVFGPLALSAEPVDECAAARPN